MKFFIDTADIAEIEDLAETGMVDGVTTNPSLVAKTGRKFTEVVADICKIVDGPVWQPRLRSLPHTEKTSL